MSVAQDDADTPASLTWPWLMWLADSAVERDLRIADGAQPGPCMRSDQMACSPPSVPAAPCRSGIYVHSPEQKAIAQKSKEEHQV